MQLVYGSEPLTHVHIDTDMGVDDGLALLLASRLFGTDLTISTVFGNVPVDIATRNALLFRGLLGRSACWTVLTGASCAQDGFTRDARHVHGSDGLGGATVHMDQALVASLTGAPVVMLGSTPPRSVSSVVLIGLGPATNIPGLVAWYGSAVERIVLMSGVYFDVGNITPSAEFNAYCDPDALRITLGLGLPVTIVPLDLCRKVQLPRSTMAAYQQNSRTEHGTLIARSHAAYMDYYREAEGIDGCLPHDAITVLVAQAPERTYLVKGTVSVDSTPQHRGRTILTPGASNVQVALGGSLRWLRVSIEALLDEDARREANSV